MKQDGQSGVDSVYAVTGVTTGAKVQGGLEKTTEDTLRALKNPENNNPINGVYAWNQLEGQKASCTGNIYGVYDLSGGYWERIPAYIANGHTNLDTNGASVANSNGALKKTSTKYTTVYPYDDDEDYDPGSDKFLDSSQNHYETNTKIFGDAVRETSTEGLGKKAWNKQDSYYPAFWYPFFSRGGDILGTNKWSGTGADSGSGIFAYTRVNGYADFNFGFRVVLVSK